MFGARVTSWSYAKSSMPMGVRMRGTRERASGRYCRPERGKKSRGLDLSRNMPCSKEGAFWDSPTAVIRPRKAHIIAELVRALHSDGPLSKLIQERA